MINSAAFQAIEKKQVPGATMSVINSETGTASAGNGRERPRGKGPLEVELGDWEVNEMQICEMGSWGPEGEYVCARGIRLD